MKLPNARNHNIVISELDGELLVYDLAINKAYCLNNASAIVFNACGARRSFEDLKHNHKFTDDLIHLALEDLRKNGLLEAGYVSLFAGMNRREVIRKVGLASMVALPVISSLIAPDAANAASGSCSSICIPIGGDICADCRLPVRLRAYTEDTGCTGQIRGSNPNFNCTAPTINNNGFDIQRN